MPTDANDLPWSSQPSLPHGKPGLGTTSQIASKSIRSICLEGFVEHEPVALIRDSRVGARLELGDQLALLKSFHLTAAQSRQAEVQ